MVRPPACYYGRSEWPGILSGPGLIIIRAAFRLKRGVVVLRVKNSLETFGELCTFIQNP